MERGIRTTLAVSHFFSVLSIALCFGAGHVVPAGGATDAGSRAAAATMLPQC